MAGGWALARDADKAIEEGASGCLAQRAIAGEAPTPERIAHVAEDGDALAVSLIQRSARNVGDSIAALVNMFNPGIIVIGGAVAAIRELFLAEVRHRVYELSLPLATRDLTIVESVGGMRDPLLGGAEMVREQLFDSPSLAGSPTDARLRRAPPCLPDPPRSQLLVEKAASKPAAEGSYVDRRTKPRLPGRR